MNIIIWAAIIQGILLGLLFLTSKQYNSYSNKILGLFLIALIVEAILAYIPIDYIFGYPINYYFSLPEPKIALPLLFLHYVLNKIGVTKKYHLLLKTNYGIFFMVVGITAFNVFLFLISHKTIADLLTFYTMEIIFLSQQTYAVLFGIVAFVIVVFEIRQYKEIVMRNYSDFGMLSISWLWNFVFLLVPALILWGAELVRIFIGYYTGTFSQWNFVSITWGVLIIFIYYVSYQAFKHNDLFDSAQKEKTDKTDPKAIKDEPDNVEELKVPLQNCMQENKLYLKSDLTLYDVAKHIGASSKKVSYCINSTFQLNFSEWVNGYRVDEVKKRFEDSSSNYLTIEAIGQEAGFKSRSAMYSAFNKKIYRSLTSKIPRNLVVPNHAFRTNLLNKSIIVRVN